MQDNPFTEAERNAWRLPAGESVSEWSERYRRIESTAAEPGPWRNDRAPYLVGIMDAYSEPEVEEITIAGPAQCGKTAAVFNMIGYTVDCDPVPSLYVIAREEDCKYIAGDRLGPMFRESPQLAAHLTGRPWDMQGKQFTFDRMPLYFGSAQAAGDLMSKPIGRLFLDETDKYRDYVGKEGNPIKLAKRRTTTYGDTKVVYLCTPTTKDGFIYTSYMRSNMQVFYVPCAKCGGYQRLEFGRLRVEPADLRDAEIIRKESCVYYECAHCGARLREDRHKYDMLAGGLWVPAGVRAGEQANSRAGERRKKGSTTQKRNSRSGCGVNKKGKLTGKPARSKRHSGFWIDGLLSPWLLWSEIMAEWFEVNTEEGIALGTLREFKNQVLAQVWAESGQAVAENALEAKRGEFSRGTVPSECLMLVAAADYHVDTMGNERLDYEVRGLGLAERNWVITSGSADSFELLEEIIFNTPYPWSDPKKKELPLAVIKMGLDTGYKPEAVYKFCLKWHPRAIPTKGQPTARTPVYISKLEQSRYKARYRGLSLYNINTSFFKDMVARWADKEAGEIGATEFYAEIPHSYFYEFCNEHKVKHTDRHGRVSYVWEPVAKGRPVHFLDTAVICAAMGWLNKMYKWREQGKAQTAQTRGRRSGGRQSAAGWLEDIPVLR